MRNPRFLIELFLRGPRWNPCSDIADPVLGDSSIQCLKSLSNGDELSSGSQAFPSLNGNVQGWAINLPVMPRGFDARVSDQSEATRFRYGTAIRFWIVVKGT
jgi:hypothetical protein